VSDRFRPVPPDEARQVAGRLGLDGPFILSVGARQARKNVPRLLEAFTALRARGSRHRLALAGPTLWSDPTLSAALARHGLGDAVVALGYVDEQDLPALYSAADLFVLPSLLEGFGLPVLEAMACGTPVVCSNTSSLPEVAGDAALLVDPLDIGEIADAMARVLADAALAAELRRRGLERAARFSWQRTARATVAVYRDVASRTGAQAAWR
jgi:glycosyltransferase involved in cell wall biosynthesis